MLGGTIGTSQEIGPKSHSHANLFGISLLDCNLNCDGQAHPIGIVAAVIISQAIWILKLEHERMSMSTLLFL